MMLSEPDTRVEGPEDEVMHVVGSVLREALVGVCHQPPREAELLSYQILARIQSRLATAGYIVRHLDQAELDEEQADG